MINYVIIIFSLLILLIVVSQITIKNTLKFIQYKDGTWGAKKKGLFGWKYLNEIYDGNWGWHYSWCYYVPDGVGIYDKFKSKKEAIKSLVNYYH